MTPKVPVDAVQIRRKEWKQVLEIRGIEAKIRERMVNNGRKTEVRTTRDERAGWMITHNARDDIVLGKIQTTVGIEI